jgi:hypothetical protein
VNLTLEQLKDLHRQGWKDFKSPFDLSYKSHWNTPWFIIREFYQNALDEHDEAEVVMPPVLKKGTEGVIIEDYGRGLGAESLLMRETKGQADLRGQFGEGLKFACLAAVRQGFTPVIESEHILIEGHSLKERMGKTDVNLLIFLWKEARYPRKGTKVTIKGYFGELYTDRFTPYLGRPMVTFSQEFGRFNRKHAIYRQPAGRLYVGDIFIRDLEKSKYSYNLWGVRLNPDRVSEISHEELHGVMSWPWSGIDNGEMAIELLKAATTPDTEESQIYWSQKPDDEYLQYAWEKMFGRRAVLYTGEATRKLAEGYGYKVVGENWSTRARDLVRDLEQITDQEIVDEVIGELVPKVVPINQLTPIQRQHLAVVRFLAKNCPISADISIQAAVIPADPRLREPTLGLCRGRDEGIFLSVGILDNLEATLGTTYHELGHAIGGGSAYDGSTAHTKEVQRIAAKLSLLMRQKVVEVARILGEETAAAAPVVQIKGKAFCWVRMHGPDGNERFQSFETPRLAGEWARRNVGRVREYDWASSYELDIDGDTIEVFWGDSEAKSRRDLNDVERKVFLFGMGL